MNNVANTIGDTTMKSLNDFANQQPRSYKTAANAQKALDQAVGAVAHLTWVHGTSLIVQRDDERFSVIIINPSSAGLSYFVSTGFGVFGVSA